MEEEKNQEGQLKVIVGQTKRQTVPTRLGSLVILLVAVIAGAGIWNYEESYTSPEPVDVSKTLEQIKEKEVKSERVDSKINIITENMLKNSEYQLFDCPADAEELNLESNTHVYTDYLIKKKFAR